MKQFAVIVLACNEDNVLGRCLQSCAGMELHVSIDKKTTDNSRAVAAQHGAALYEHEFVNNSWADTRNGVMAQVEAASEAGWFAWLDADEWWLEGTDLLPAALQMAAEQDVQGVGVLLQDHEPASGAPAGRWPNVKILRRGTRFQRRRHEVVPASCTRIQANEIVIGHRKGQRPEVIAANEALKADLSALLADFGEFGDRRSAYYVADGFVKSGDLQSAVAWYERGLTLPPNQAGMEQLLRDGLAACYRSLGQVAKAREVARAKLLCGPEEFGEACFDIGVDSHNLNDPQQAQFYLRMALAAGVQPRTGGVGHPEKCGALAYYVLALSEFSLGHFKQAAAWLGKAEESGPHERYTVLWQRIIDEASKELTANAVVRDDGPGGADGGCTDVAGADG